MSDDIIDILNVLKMSVLHNYEISRRLNISENAVKAYMTSLILMFGAKNRTGALIMAIKKGLIDIDSVILE